MIVNFTRVFAAAHRVWNDPGKCRNIHGHNYNVAVSIDADDLTEQGFIVPFDTVKDVIDAFDHVLILHKADPELGRLSNLEIDIVEVPLMPSTENLARLIAEEIKERIVAEGRIDRFTVIVGLRETAGIEAEYTAGFSRSFTPGRDLIRPA